MLEIGWNNFRAAPPAKPSCKSPHTRYSSTSSSPLVEEDVHEPCSAEASQNAHTGIQLENSTFLARILSGQSHQIHNAYDLDILLNCRRTHRHTVNPKYPTFSHALCYSSR
jgi:hypothetical protein